MLLFCLTRTSYCEDLPNLSEVDLRQSSVFEASPKGFFADLLSVVTLKGSASFVRPCVRMWHEMLNDALRYANWEESSSNVVRAPR